MDPAVILLDEPSAGVAQRDTEALGPLLRRVQRETGSAILIIEHDMGLLGSLCDELVALELGAVIGRGRPDEVLTHPRVVESYLGTNEATIHRSGTNGARPDHGLANSRANGSTAVGAAAASRAPRRRREPLQARRN